MDYADNFIGTYLDDRYEILEKIGSGGMAEVYKARCHRLNRLVAIKILRRDFSQDEELRRRFHAESQAVAMLSSPNIVSVYDVGSTGNVDYIVMELIEGITLKQYISRKGVLSWKEALHFSTQISKALSHAHSRGIIHRDIKPHNIMILRDGSVKVTDFGIACLFSTQNTLTQQALGSVHYISPEQAQGGHVDTRTDIYSLGVVMYEMLTGRLPFEGESAVSIAIQHISSVPLSPRDINPDIPEGLEMITMKAMEPNLSMRYESIDDLIYDLEEFRKNPNMLPRRESPAERTTDDDERGEASERRERIRRNAERKKPKRTPEKTTKDKQRSKEPVKSMPLIIAGLAVLLVLSGFFLWQFVIKDMLGGSNDVQVTIDNFVGQNVQDVTTNAANNEKYEFEIVTEKNEEIEAGIIISQTPTHEDQITPPKEGEKIKITLTVSEGAEPVLMPNFLNKDYKEVKYQLDSLQLDLVIEMVPTPSEDVTPGFVIEQYPKEGAELIKGGTVYIKYSDGPNIETVKVPNVTSLSESAAILRLQSYNLSYKVERVHDNAEKGTVIFQSYEVGQEVPLHTEVVLQVSLGPEQTEPPEPGNNDPLPPVTGTTPNG